MPNHYEAIAEHLASNGWDPDPKHSSDRDHNLDTRTFLNCMVVQEAHSPSTSRIGSRVESGKEVSFEPRSAHSPASTSNYSDRNLKRRILRPVVAITTTRTFTNGVDTVAVLWPHQSSSPVDWCGVPPSLDREITHIVIENCAPWSWISNPIPSSPEAQIWWRDTIYTAIDITAKLRSLQRQNLVLTQGVDAFTVALSSAARAANRGAQIHLSTLPRLEMVLWQLVDIRNAHERLLQVLDKLLAHQPDMLRLVDRIKAEVQQITLARPPSSSSSFPSNSPPHSLHAIIKAKGPGLLLALSSVQNGLHALGETMASDAVAQFSAVRSAALSLVPCADILIKQAQETGEDDDTEFDDAHLAEHVAEWYRLALLQPCLRGVPGHGEQDIFAVGGDDGGGVAVVAGPPAGGDEDENDQVHNGLADLAGPFEAVEQKYQGWNGVVKGLEAGARGLGRM